MTGERPYEGSELALFARATRWKRYWSSRIRPYFGSQVIEVGAGLGSNTPFMNDGSADRWECLEPDRLLSEQITAARLGGLVPSNVVVRCATLAGRVGDPVDTIAYIDVLEHILDDRAELQAARSHLKPGGHVVVLAPAHQWLYSPFDAAIGHHRRYSRPSLVDVASSELRLVDAFYLDSVGLLASALNRFALKSAMPSAAQIQFWDTILVRASEVVDRATFGQFGKTVVAVWQRP